MTATSPATSADVRNLPSATVRARTDSPVGVVCPPPTSIQLVDPAVSAVERLVLGATPATSGLGRRCARTARSRRSPSGCDASRAAAHTGRRACCRLGNHQQVAEQRVDRRRDLLLGARAESDGEDHRGDADQDAQYWSAERSRCERDRIQARPDRFEPARRQSSVSFLRVSDSISRPAGGPCGWPTPRHPPRG